MPIPPFTLDGVLPPFLGDIPARQSSWMSPYPVSVTEVVNHFASTDERKAILAGWLEYRRILRGIGLTQGFQWLDGSFLEDKETLRNNPPGDIDVVIFTRRPADIKSDRDWKDFIGANRSLFDHGTIKRDYKVDAYFVDLDGNSRDIVLQTRYFLLLFSHQRDTHIWKGLLEVEQDAKNEDDAALSILKSNVPEVTP